MSERITAVALKRGEKLVKALRGGSHSELRASLGDENPYQARASDVEGFVTSRGRFVTRKEAVPIAIEARQIHPAWSQVSRDLLSSDLDW
jgi:hypothetical protein